MRYLLNWNDEYLDIRILSGPLVDDAAARKVMKERLIERLVELNVANDAKDAEEMYLTAEKKAGREEAIEGLHVSPYGASIEYGGGYQDRYQIVEYQPETA